MHKLLDSTYVDDIISGGQSEDDVLDLYSQAKMIFREGGFNLRIFQTNSSLVQARIDASEDTGSPQSELTYSETTFGTTPHSQAEGTKVLGVLWNPEDDRLTFDITGIAKIAFDLVPAKRNLVSLIGKFYDPLGFLSPIIVRFKMLFQKLCGCKCSWDDVISGETLKEWKILVADLQLAVPVSIPRTFFHELDSPLVSATLCGFCDASARAYGCVVYLVLRTNSTVAIQFVAAKTRIAPLNGQTVPRLELLSALLLSRLIASVQNSLSSQRLHLDVYCFTDSLVGLYWIRGRDREWKPFVQNRVVKIRRSVQPDQWYHCPGITNPADLPSRGLSIVELSSSLLWRTGPEFLKNAIPPDPAVSL